MDSHPSFLLDFRLGIELARNLPQMLACVVQINDLDRVREVFGDQVPDPLRTIADHHLLFCTAPTALRSFAIDPFAELHCVFDGPGVGGGIRVADGVALLIPGGLCEHTSQLDLPSM